MKYLVDLDGRRVEVELADGVATVDGVRMDVRLTEVAGTPVFLLATGDEVHHAVVRRNGGRGLYTISMGGWRFEAEALDERRRAIRDLVREAAAAAGPVPLVAPMPGMIVRVSVEVGTVVEAGAGLVVMEAMKMENELRASAAGKVLRVLVTAGQAVEKGAPLVEFE